MASQKTKKSGKKNNSQPEPKKEELKEVKDEEVTVTEDEETTEDTEEIKEEAVEKPETSTTKSEKAEATTEKKTTVVASTNNNPFKDFFARKCDDNENILTIFKSTKIWGALISEVIGTFFITTILLLVCAFGSMFQYAVYLFPALIFVYIILVKLSGANFNPIVTAGLMASRRMSAIRGILYMLAQLLGGWIALIVVNAFRLGSGAEVDLPMMTEITGESFWSVALVELVGAIILAFCFARAIRYSKRSALTFAIAIVSSLIFVITFGATISQGLFQIATGFTFNPVVSLMYQILPTSAENLGELAQMAGLAVAAYVLIPMVGGIVGFYVSDIITRLSAGGYRYEYDAEDSCKCHACKCVKE